MPPFFRARFQRFTEDLEAPTISITSPIVLPARRSCPASRRRVSNSAALPCFLINYCTHGHTTWFIYQAKLNSQGNSRCQLERTHQVVVEQGGDVVQLSPPEQEG